MSPAYTPLKLTRKLLSFDTVNPPGNERDCARFLGDLLEAGGFSVSYHEFDEKRTNLVARKMFKNDRPPICFTGHLDTVPLGLADWSRDPFVGELEGDKLYGRGSSDMKSGVAAMVLAALAIAGRSGGSSGVSLVLTAGEENGCQGADYLAGLGGVLGEAGALVVGEPTANYPVLGHKGAFWLEGRTSGVTAHGSMPDQGVNAIYRAARAISKLESYDFGVAPHPVLGAPTLNVGTVSGGININSVPDRTVFGIDIRTVPPLTGDGIVKDLRAYLGKEVELTEMTNAAAVASDPDNEWVREVFDLAAAALGERPVPRGVTYFTDASALAAAFGGPPVVILGPGETGMAHKTDEYCRVANIETAVDLYTEMARRWCCL
jgi:succinyl-diaminopimelate desuccinylase